MAAAAGVADLTLDTDQGYPYLGGGQGAPLVVVAKLDGAAGEFDTANRDNCYLVSPDGSVVVTVNDVTNDTAGPWLAAALCAKRKTAPKR